MLPRATKSLRPAPLDNFEWGYGYAKRFGIVRVGFDTLERTVKDSGHGYRELVRSRTIGE